MTSLKIDTSPVAKAATGMGRIADELDDTGPLLAKVADDIARTAGPRTPRATGKLAGSLSVRTDTTGRAVVRWGVGYAVYVNFGTRYMRARPFATDALHAAETTLDTLARQWATDALTKV